MRGIHTFILICGIIIMIGCGGCGGGDDGTTPPPKDEPLAEGSIGNSGGTLASGDFTLDVPAGAFADEVDLSLRKASVDGLPDDSITGVYGLEGLPDVVAGPLVLAMRFNEPPAGDPLIGVGFETTSLETGRKQVLFTYLDAIVDGDRLTGTWRPLAADGQATKTNNRLAFLYSPHNLEKTCVPDEGNPHFVIDAPLLGRELVGDLGAALEQAYQLYAGLGFDMTLAAEPALDLVPMEITFTSQAPPADEYVQFHWMFWQEMRSKAGICLYNDRLSPGGLDALKIAVGNRIAAIIHRAQSPYLVFDPQHGWKHFRLEPAVRMWAEGLFATDPEHVPHGFDLDGWTLQEGVVYPLFDGTDIHPGFSKALTALLKYLMDEEDNGAALLLRTYAATRTGADPGEAFLDAIAGDAGDWWPGFLEALLTGGIYAQTSDAFLDQTSDFTIDQEIWSAAPTGFYTDLSARLFRIDPAYAGWDETTFLDLAVSSPDVNPDYLEALVFQLRDGEITFLASGADVRIENLASFRDNGAELLVLVANAAWTVPSTGASEISLEMTVGEGQVTIDAQMQLNLVVLGQFVDESMPRVIEIQTGPSHVIHGTFDGSVFTGSWEYTSTEYQYAETCTLTCRLDPEADPPLLYEWSLMRDLIHTDTGDSTHIEASGGEVPHDESGQWGQETFAIWGAGACDPVDEITYVEIEDDAVTTELESYSCTDDSSIILHFYPWR